MASLVNKVFALNLLGLQFNWTKDGALDWPDILLPDASKILPEFDANRIRTNTLNAHIQLAMDSALIPVQRDLYIPDGSTISGVTIYANLSPFSGHKLKAYLDNNPYGAEMTPGSGFNTIASFVNDPTTGLPWTRANLAVRTFGIQLTATAAGELTCNVIAIQIDWVPPGPFFSPSAIPTAGGVPVTISQCLAESGLGNFLRVLGTFDFFGADSIIDEVSLIATPPAESAGIRAIDGDVGGSTINFGYGSGLGGTFHLENLEWTDVIDMEFSDPDYDYNIQGGLNLGDLGITSDDLVLITDGSGIYGITPGQFYDRLYTRNTTTSDQLSVTIPNPFFETTYLGDS